MSYRIRKIKVRSFRLEPSLSSTSSFYPPRTTSLSSNPRPPLISDIPIVLYQTNRFQQHSLSDYRSNGIFLAIATIVYRFLSIQWRFLRRSSYSFREVGHFSEFHDPLIILFIDFFAEVSTPLSFNRPLSYGHPIIHCPFDHPIIRSNTVSGRNSFLCG